MASIRYDKRRKRWEVRKQVTDPRTCEVVHLHTVLPKGSTRPDADQISRQFDAKATAIKLGRVRIAERLSVAKQQWLRYNLRHTASTQGFYEMVITRFVASLPDPVATVDQVHTVHIQNYISSILEAGRLNRTANSQLTAIKSFCRWAAVTYDIANPAAAITMLAEDPPDQRFFENGEHEKVMAAADSVFLQRVLFIQNTGVRATEFSKLVWASVSADGKSLTIEGKGRKRRVVPLNKTCRDVLDELRSPDATRNTPIFLSKSSKKSQQGKPVTRHALHQMCAALARKLSMPLFGPHAFRHWFATQLLLNGVPISHVSKLLGHSSIKTTEQIYIHILPPDLAGTTDCLV